MRASETPVAPNQQLLARAQSGDPAAFTEFVIAYKPIMFRWAMGFTLNGDEAEDVVQEAFVVAYQKLGSYRGDGSLEGWLYRVTRRVAVRKARKQKRRSILGASPKARPTLEVYLTDPGARVDRDEAVALIRESARDLPLRQREIFDLCDLQGISPSDVAELLGLNAVSVRANLFKARSSIRKRILMTHSHFAELKV
jgi:RNA polymerase sigma-70 factor (ECF subfamily)